MNATRRWPNVLALAGLLVAGAALLIAVTSGPVDDDVRPDGPLRVAIAVPAATMLALALANSLDAPEGSPLSSQVPYAVTLPTLVLCAVASLVLDRWRGTADSATSR
jgi:hypothetical protein